MSHLKQCLASFLVHHEPPKLLWVAQPPAEVTAQRQQCLLCCLHYSNLTSDLQHLRQLLHEEKEAAATANSLLDSSQPHLLPGTHIPLQTATREQVLQQLTIVLGKHATERARNGELVRRLQQLHAEKVDVIELQRQYLELQEAHFQQVRVACSSHEEYLLSLMLSLQDVHALRLMV
jgi:hypothetical protein